MHKTDNYMDAYFFSICIPTYKQPLLLKTLLHSIELQTFKDFEVIISDDTNDDSIELVTLEEWSFKLKYYRNEKPLGSPENWNNAIEKANGRWIKLIHHDDYLANNDSLKIFHETVSKNQEIDFFFCSTMIYNAKTKDIIEYHPNQKYLNTLEKLPTNLFFSNVIGAPSATIFRSNIKIKFDKSLIWLVDIEFYTQLILRYKIHRLLDKLIITSSELESQLTSSLKDNKNIELFEFFYCYNKLRNLLDNQNKQVFLNVLFDTIDKYSIKSVNEIKAFEVKIIKNTLLYFYINIPSKFIKKVIRKLNNTF